MISRRRLLNRSGALLASVVAAGCTSRLAQTGKRFACDFTRIHEGGTAPIYGIAWSPDGMLLASSSSGDTRIALWDTGRRRRIWELRKLGVSLGTRSLQFTPNGAFLLVSSAETEEAAPRGTLSLIEVATGKIAHTVEVPPKISRRHRAASWAISANGRYIAASLWTPGEGRGALAVFDGETLRFERSIAMPYYEGRRLAFDPLTDALATQSINYDLSNPHVGRFPRDPTKSGIEIWNIERSEIVKYIPAHPSAINTLSYIPGTHLLITGADARTRPGSIAPPIDPNNSELVRVWDTVSGERVKTLHEDIGTVADTAVSSDMALLATVSRSSTLRIHDFESGTRVDKRKFGKAFTHAVAFSPSKPQIALAADNSIYIGTYTYQ